MKPITVIGGGLAGLTLGIALRRRQIPVTVLESGQYPRHRVCGEFINGRGNDVLERLGLRELLVRRGANSASTGCFISGNRSSPVRQLLEPALCLSRYTMDALLADAFRDSGGVLQSESRLGESDYPEGIVRATGRRRHACEQGWRWFGLKVHARNVRLTADLEMHILPNGYVGLCRLGDGEVNVCGLFRRPAAGRPPNAVFGQGLPNGSPPRGENSLKPFVHYAPEPPIGTNRAASTPSPWGEGWGEGDRNMRVSQRVHAEADQRVRRPATIHEEGCGEGDHDARPPETLLGNAVNRIGPASEKVALLLGPAESSLRQRLAQAEFDESSLCSVAGLSLRPQRATQLPECSIGDALTMTPPVTGNGMSMAFESAELAVEPLAAYSHGSLGWADARDAIARACDNAFARRLACARALQWMMFSPLLQGWLGRAALRSDWLWRVLFANTR